MKRNDRYFWYCCACGAQNSREDGECQFCDCEGPDCKRDNCSGANHRAALAVEGPQVATSSPKPSSADPSKAVRS